ncbi:unnamed protein product [Schistosoma turkestanicum]|nr:unnamed protein product [Schistosoma turkestanicum]
MRIMTSRQLCLSLPESYQINSLKFIYLTCATVITTTFIVECILIHLVVQPYFHESAFTHTNCSFVHAHIVRTDVKCENKCSKDRSKFPCLRVIVQYLSGNKNHTVILFDNIATYNHYKFLGCATSACHHRDMDNTEWVEKFQRRIRLQRHFRCYVHATHEDEALLYKFYTFISVFHAIFWPVTLFLASSICLGIIYLFDKCRVWTGDQDVIV